MTVTSRASSSAMLPATVEAFVERDSTRFPHPVMIYANVRKGIYPILNATVTATIEPEAADPIVLKLFDNGAGNRECHAMPFFMFSRAAVVLGCSILSLSVKFFQFNFFSHPIF